MTKRSQLTVTVAVLTLASTVAFGSLYFWNEAKRPPIALSNALARAEKLLAADAANRYCVSVSLYGDKTGQGKEGAWNLRFAAADGSKKHVHINMQGRGDVTLWNGPIDWKKKEGRRTDLADVRRRLEELFAKEGIKAEFDANEERLLVKYKAREFQVYPQRDDGSYVEELQLASGPAAEGIWLQVRIVNQPDARKYGYNDGPYWRWVRGTYFLTESGKVLAIDLRYGPNVRYEVARQMWDILASKRRAAEATNDRLRNE